MPPRVGNIRTPVARYPIPEEIVYVRPGGSDLWAGTQESPLATIWEALARAPSIIDDRLVVIDASTVDDVATDGQRFVPPKLSSIPASVLLSGGRFNGDISRAPITLIAAPIPLATVTVTGTQLDARTGMARLTTNANLTLNQYRGYFIRGAGAFQFGTVFGNTAGPNAEIYCSLLEAPTAPVEICDYGADIAAGDLAEGFNLSQMIDMPCALAITGFRLRSDRSNFGAALTFNAKSEIYFAACEVQGIYAQAGGSKVWFDYCYLNGANGVEGYGANGCALNARQSYLRNLKMLHHGAGANGGYGWFWCAIEGCEPLGHHNNLQAVDGFDVSECDIISPTSHGVRYRGGPQSRVRNTYINGGTIGIYADGPGKLLAQNVAGTTGDVGLAATDGGQIDQSSCTVTGANGAVRVGSTVRAYNELPFTDATVLARVF